LSLAVGLGLLFAAGTIGRAQSEGLLMGLIKGPAGEPMEGVIVSARLEGRSFTTSVYTDADGEYYFPAMAAGPYKVWAQAVGFEAGRADVALAAAGRQDFVLKAKKDFEAQLPGDRWVDGLPEDTPEDRRMKTVFRVSCGGCHSQNTALLNRFDEKGWRNILTVMSRIATSGYAANALSSTAAGEDMAPNPLIDYYKERLARYLAKVRGPGVSPAKFTPRPRPTGEAVLAVIREYDTPGNGYGLPLWENGTDWSEGAPSKTNRQNHHAMDGTLDFEGNLFFTDDLNTNPYRSVGKIDWRTGKISNVKVPRRNNPAVAATVHDLVADQEGILWFGADGTLIRLDPRTLKWDAMTSRDGESVPSGGFNAVDGKGGIWSATRGASRFDPKTRTFTQTRNTITRSKLGAVGTYGMAGDGDGNGWLAQFAIDVMVRHDPVTGKIDNVQLPPPPNVPEPGLFTGDDRKIFDMMGGSLYQGHGHPWMHTVRKPGGGPDAVWGPGWTSDYLVKIDLRTLAVQLYRMPYRDIGNYQAVVDKDGFVWNVFTNADAVGRFDPRTEKWIWYDLPTRGTETHGLQVVAVNGRVQLAVPYWGSSKMAKLEFLTAEERQSLKAEARKRARP
jgi:streptogramin lyase